MNNWNSSSVINKSKWCYLFTCIEAVYMDAHACLNPWSHHTVHHTVMTKQKQQCNINYLNPDKTFSKNDPNLHVIFGSLIWVNCRPTDFVLSGVRKKRNSSADWCHPVSCWKWQRGRGETYPFPHRPVQPDWLDMAQNCILFSSLCRLANLKPVRPVLQQ